MTFDSLVTCYWLLSSCNVVDMWTVQGLDLDCMQTRDGGLGGMDGTG